MSASPVARIGTLVSWLTGTTSSLTPSRFAYSSASSQAGPENCGPLPLVFSGSHGNSPMAATFSTPRCLMASIFGLCPGAGTSEPASAIPAPRTTAAATAARRMKLAKVISPSLGRVVIERHSIPLPASVESGCPVEHLAGNGYFGLYQIFGERRPIDLDAETHALRRPDFAIHLTVDVLDRKLMRERLQRYRVLREAMVAEAGIGLQRGAEREMRGVSVVDIGHTLPCGMRGHGEGRADAADPAAIDLNEPHLTEIDEIARHQFVMRRFPTGKTDLRRYRRERGMRCQRMAGERLLEP